MKGLFVIHKWQGLLVGGVLPAIILGVFGVLQKSAMRSGASPAVFFTVAGMSIAVCGLIWWVIEHTQPLPGKQALLVCALTGLMWFAGVSLILLVLRSNTVSVSQLTPLYNMNTLVVVLLGMVVYAEWQQVRMVPLIIGAVLIVVGGTLVARA